MSKKNNKTMESMLLGITQLLLSVPFGGKFISKLLFITLFVTILSGSWRAGPTYPFVISLVYTALSISGYFTILCEI